MSSQLPHPEDEKESQKGVKWQTTQQRPLSENVQMKRGRPDHVKRKLNLKLNESLNQANDHKHGRGR